MQKMVSSDCKQYFVNGPLNSDKMMNVARNGPCTFRAQNMLGCPNPLFKVMNMSRMLLCTPNIPKGGNAYITGASSLSYNCTAGIVFATAAADDSGKQNKDTAGNLYPTAASTQRPPLRSTWQRPPT